MSSHIEMSNLILIMCSCNLQEKLRIVCFVSKNDTNRIIKIWESVIYQTISINLRAPSEVDAMPFWILLGYITAVETWGLIHVAGLPI